MAPPDLAPDSMCRTITPILIYQHPWAGVLAVLHMLLRHTCLGSKITVNDTSFIPCTDCVALPPWGGCA